MCSAALIERLDSLIDDLIVEGSVESASLASILLAAKDSVTQQSLVSFSRKVWAANNDLMVDEPVPQGPFQFDQT